MTIMKFGDLLKFSAGLVAGAIMMAATAQAAPLPPLSGQTATVPALVNVEPAVVSQNEVDQMKPLQVHWHRHHWHHGHWHRHYWHHRHWHRHYWNHRHWHHRHWRHR